MSAGIVAGSRIFLPVPSSTQPAQGQRSRRRAAGTPTSGPPAQTIRMSPLAETSIASGGATSCFLKAILSRSPMSTFLVALGPRRQAVRASAARTSERSSSGERHGRASATYSSEAESAGARRRTAEERVPYAGSPWMQVALSAGGAWTVRSSAIRGTDGSSGQRARTSSPRGQRPSSERSVTTWRPGERSTSAVRSPSYHQRKACEPSATARWNGFQRVASAARSTSRAAAAVGAARAMPTISPRERRPGSGYHANGAWKFVSPAKTPRADTPIQVPPPRTSRGAARRTPPWPSRSAQLSEGRPSRSSRFAATTMGQRRSTRHEMARVHMPSVVARKHRRCLVDVVVVVVVDVDVVVSGPSADPAPVHVDVHVHVHLHVHECGTGPAASGRARELPRVAGKYPFLYFTCRAVFTRSRSSSRSSENGRGR